MVIATPASKASSSGGAYDWNLCRRDLLRKEAGAQMSILFDPSKLHGGYGHAFVDGQWIRIAAARAE